MELRNLAQTILEQGSLDAKLTPPGTPLEDRSPGPPRRLEAPVRTPELRIEPADRVKVPPLAGMADPAQRRRILHALANHELQATELFAWALLAFPTTPPAFRRGLATILQDEQRHTRMYIGRLEALGGRFGEFPVNGYFWNKVETISSPLAFVCAMGLTFEAANLDHTVAYADAARRAGDLKTARVIDQVHRDEITHVHFGWRWLNTFKEEGESAWDAYRRSLTWPLRPAKARGAVFQRADREAAGLDEGFIRNLEASAR